MWLLWVLGPDLPLRGWFKSTTPFLDAFVLHCSGSHLAQRISYRQWSVSWEWGSGGPGSSGFTGPRVRSQSYTSLLWKNVSGRLHTSQYFHEAPGSVCRLYRGLSETLLFRCTKPSSLQFSGLSCVSALTPQVLIRRDLTIDFYECVHYYMCCWSKRMCPLLKELGIHDQEAGGCCQFFLL